MGRRHECKISHRQPQTLNLTYINIWKEREEEILAESAVTADHIISINQPAVDSEKEVESTLCLDVSFWPPHLHSGSQQSTSQDEEILNRKEIVTKFARTSQLNKL
ncbi:hypothetical protein AVEN_268489-1, partial [Araneus ventricosus]